MSAIGDCPGRVRLAAIGVALRVIGNLRCCVVAYTEGLSARWKMAPVWSTMRTVKQADRELKQRLADAYDENGVDRSLIRWCLQQTPAQRLANLEATLNLAASARRGAEPDVSVSKTS